jgi:hypothetical protein
MDPYGVIGGQVWRKLRPFIICGWSTLGSPTVYLGRQVFLKASCRWQRRRIITGALSGFGAKTHQHLRSSFSKEFRWSHKHLQTGILAESRRILWNNYCSWRTNHTVHKFISPRIFYFFNLPWSHLTTKKKSPWTSWILATHEHLPPRIKVILWYVFVA